jgi:hypothetical protein
MTHVRSRTPATAGLLGHRLFGWMPRLVLLATFVLGVIAPARVARSEGETEWKERRAPVEEEVETVHAAAIRSGPRHAPRGAASPGVFVLAPPPRILAPTIASPLTNTRARLLPRRTGPPPDEDDLG